MRGGQSRPGRSRFGCDGNRRTRDKTLGLEVVPCGAGRRAPFLLPCIPGYIVQLRLSFADFRSGEQHVGAYRPYRLGARPDLYTASSMIELMFGRPRPGFVPVAQLILVAPILIWLWRDKIHPAD